MTKTFTPEQRKAYFDNLKKEWREAKETAEKEKPRLEIALMAARLEGVSLAGFVLVEKQMARQGLSGVPVLDAKTYQKWKDLGYKVKKGEHSTLHGITFVKIQSKEKEGQDKKEPEYSMPKAYSLFHISQVEKHS